MLSEPAYEVFAPTGQIVRDVVPVNQHPSDLSHKTVGFVWDYLFKGPVIFDAIRKLIDARFTGVKYVDYDQFGDIHGLHGVDSGQVLRELPDRILAAGVDVAIVAVGA
jgi:hypothetical protein